MQEAEVDMANEVRARLWDKRPQMSEDAWSAANKEFFIRYPFMATISLARADREYADQAFAWDVLNRLPPQPKEILEGMGLPYDLVLRFKRDGGFEKAEFTTTERMRFMAAILDLSERYKVPTPHMLQQWREAQIRNSELYEYLGRKYPGSEQLEEAFYALPNSEEMEVFKLEHPMLQERWNMRDEIRTSDPLLAFFYLPEPRKQAKTFIWGVYWGLDKAGRRALTRTWPQHFKDNFLDGNYDAITDEEYFTIVAHLGGTLYRAATTEQALMPQDIVVRKPEDMAPAPSALPERFRRPVPLNRPLARPPAYR